MEPAMNTFSEGVPSDGLIEGPVGDADISGIRTGLAKEKEAYGNRAVYVSIQFQTLDGHLHQVALDTGDLTYLIAGLFDKAFRCGPTFLTPLLDVAQKYLPTDPIP
jgi:hypothetical protein